MTYSVDTQKIEWMNEEMFLNNLFVVEIFCPKKKKSKNRKRMRILSSSDTMKVFDRMFVRKN